MKPTFTLLVALLLAPQAALQAAELTLTSPRDCEVAQRVGPKPSRRRRPDASSPTKLGKILCETGLELLNCIISDKRAIKSPKIYFTDVGLLCFLLGIRSGDQVSRDPLVGGIFENLVVMECVKARYNRGQPADFWFFRDSNGNEVDLVWQEGHALAAAEIKSASTFSMSLLKGLGRFRGVVPSFARGALIYSGDPHILSDGTEVRHFGEAAGLFEPVDGSLPEPQ